MTTHPKSPALPSARIRLRGGVVIRTLIDWNDRFSEYSAMPSPSRESSARQLELLELAYQYVLRHGLTSLSLRPLAQAIGSSPRVLLFLFGSKEGLVQALLARARAAELEMLNQMPPTGTADDFAS